MDMPMPDDEPMAGMSTPGMMKPYLHFTLGDALLFREWVPMSGGATFGACVGLFLLAMVDRLLAAFGGIMRGWWARDALKRRLVETQQTTSSISDDSGEALKDETPTRPVTGSKAPGVANETVPGAMLFLRHHLNFRTFVPRHDITRGVLHAVQAAIGFALMLSVMTFDAAYFISIVLGLGAGEVLFGRFGRIA
ncbi:hypothetical protein BOTBODRAFT_27276 [Botryobasidium botryosum FD-172 SS1]|uniref:Copper transport protein n=1 Tax=Botryobasidium botryosum (strain FD-172 SS1) TaxID=930990 RepID=A0A067MYV3_BOTB1|nr:hypothetical protein BOTBODRAFT_27276 [Botryobasidium botryosum FD-172 SS1]